MISVNRDTIMMIATVVCALGIIFLFKELSKTKEEMNNFKSFAQQIMAPMPVPAPTPTPVPAPVPAPEPEPVKESKE